MRRHEELIARVRAACAADRSIAAALMYGSLARGRGDEHSDVEFYLYFSGGAEREVDRLAWVERIAPVALAYENEWGTFAVVFDDLVRGEFHFEPVTAIPAVAGWRGAWFPDTERALVKDETGQLGPLVEARARQPRLDTPAERRFLAASLANWSVMGAAILARGDDARAYAFLPFVHDFLLRAARLEAGATQEWVNPVARLAADLPEAARRLVGCSAPIDHPRLLAAYAETVAWAIELCDTALAPAPAARGVLRAVAARLDRRA